MGKVIKQKEFRASSRRLLPFGVGLLLALAAFPVRGAGRQTLHGTMPAGLPALTPTGRLPATNRLHLAIALPLRNAADRSNLLQQIYDPASPNYHHYLTPAEFTEKFGPTEQDYQAVIAFAGANHLQVTTTHPNRLLLDVSGTAAAVEQALHVTLHTYQHPTENRTFYAPNQEPSLDLRVPVMHIGGLDNYALPRPHLHATRLMSGQNAYPNTFPPSRVGDRRSRRLMSGQNASPNTGSGPSGTYMGPDFRAAYVPNTTLDGSGQVVGLLQFDGYTPSDITYYESKAGLPNVPLQNVLLDGFSGSPTGDGGEVEVSLDIENSISMATNLSKVIVYEAGPYGSWHDILNRMANDNLARQLSCSWYIPGGAADPVADGIFQQMAAQGQSFFNASGDDDAYTGLINFPGDSPYITQVGGTTLTTTGPKGAWVSETVWNWGDGIGSGGGISTQYPIPSWQTNINMAANQGSTTMRNTPDVAFIADQVYVRADGQDYNVGGTSCAAPLWAGFAALVNQQAAGSGQPAIGFLNPAVDAIGSDANYPTTFHDITTGNNTNGSSPKKFYAVAGYDLCTGWGTPAGPNLINALANPEPLLISPTIGFAAIGGVGGPFFPVTSQNYSLTNSGTNALTWTLSNTSLWLNASSSGGTLLPGGPAATVPIRLNSTASNLPVGSYAATLSFTNQNDNLGQSRQFALSVISPPSIMQQPTNQAVLEGATAAFSVQAAGGLPLVYQWQLNGTNLADGGAISGSATTHLTINDVSAANMGVYTVVVTNFAGAVTSSNAALSLTPSMPVIVTQPASQPVEVGGTVTFTVAALGTTPFSYQWSFNGTNLDGATNAALILSNVQSSQAGGYSAAVGNIYGTTNSAVANLTVFIGPITWFFDDFNGPSLNSIWVTNLPDNAHSGSFPFGSSQTASYLGAPNFHFQMLGTNTVLRLTNSLNTLQRIGWCSVSNFPGTDFYYEARFNTLTLSSTTSIDGFIEIWILDAANSNRYDIVSPFSGSYSAAPSFFVGSSIDNAYTETAVNYQNNTWYRLVLQSVPGQNIRASMFNDDGTELIGCTLDHSAAVLTSGFEIGLSQSVGYAGGVFPVDVAVDHVKLTTGFAPAITVQPANQTVLTGGTVDFSVTATGTSPLDYQWVFNDTPISGATNAALALTNVQANQAGNYMVQITNQFGAVLSSNAILAVGTTPAITTQPQSQTVPAGSTATFTVTATGTLPLSYQWQCNGTNLAAATNASLTLTNVQFAQSANYTVLITNLWGSVLSSNAALTVQAAPVITSQPASQSVPAGGTAVVSAIAAGTPPLSYQWTFNTINIPGGTNTVLTLTNVQLTQAGTYALSVSNAYGSTLSSNGVLTVYPVSPFIAVQPAGQTVPAGGTATFSVSAGGTPPLGYQWSVKSVPIAAATNASLTLTNVQFSQAGNYTVKVSSPYGTTNSSIAALTVVSPFPVYFFDDFNGPNLNSAWQASLPSAYSGSFPYGSSQIAPYLGAPGFHFEMLGTNSVIHLTNFMGPLQRRGWSSTTNFAGTNFYYDVRFNSLTQSSTTSIDGFIEIWIMDAANSNRYDIISPFGGDYGTQPSFFAGSSIDVSYTETAVSYQNNTWYHLVLQNVPGQNIRGSIYTDSGTELIGHTFAHNASTYGSGFKIVISQIIGSAGAAYPDNVDVDYAKLTVFPPTIIGQPTNQTVLPGASAQFTTAAAGVLPLYYQWTSNSVNISGATNATLMLTNVQASQSGNYVVLVTNLYGSATSSVAQLTVLMPPSITQPPAGSTNVAGTTAIFAAAATGAFPLAYQWQKNSVPLNNGGNVSGATATGLTLAGVQDADAASYALVVTNVAGSVTSTPALLVVLDPPTITLQPTNQFILVGSNAVLAAAASGTAPLGCQWSCNGTNLCDTPRISGSQCGVLVISNAVVRDTGNYQVLFTNNLGSATSSVAVLTVGRPPQILSGPASHSAPLGCTVSFSIVASGSRPLADQWWKDGSLLDAQTNATLTVTNFQSADLGGYSVVLTNWFGSITSAPAVLSVGYHPPVAGAAVVQRFAAGGVRISVTDLLANDVDTNGDRLTIMSVNPNSTAGGSVGLANNWVYYAPPAGWTNSDSFTYMVSDGLCETAEGTVLVQVTANNPQPAQFGIGTQPSGPVQLSFTGIPGNQYQIQYADSLVNPNWQVLATQAADSYGVCQFTDLSPTNTTARYYRAVPVLVLQR